MTNNIFYVIINGHSRNAIIKREMFIEHMKAIQLWIEIKLVWLTIDKQSKISGWKSIKLFQDFPRLKQVPYHQSSVNKWYKYHWKSYIARLIQKNFSNIFFKFKWTGFHIVFSRFFSYKSKNHPRNDVNYIYKQCFTLASGHIHNS